VDQTTHRESNQASGTSAGFELIEQILREKVAGQTTSRQQWLDQPLEQAVAAAEGAVNPKSKRYFQVIAAGFAETSELIDVLSGSNVS